MSEIIRVSSKGQIVIPKAIRDALDLQDGTTLAVTRVADMVVFKRLPLPDLETEFKRVSKKWESLARRIRGADEATVVDWVRSERRKKSRSKKSAG